MSMATQKKRTTKKTTAKKQTAKKTAPKPEPKPESKADSTEELVEQPTEEFFKWDEPETETPDTEDRTEDLPGFVPDDSRFIKDEDGMVVGVRAQVGNDAAAATSAPDYIHKYMDAKHAEQVSDTQVQEFVDGLVRPCDHDDLDMMSARWDAMREQTPVFADTLLDICEDEWKPEEEAHAPNGDNFNQVADEHIDFSASKTLMTIWGGSQ